MKTNGLLLLIIFSLFSFCACEDNSHPRILVVADSLVNVNPDSAVVLLKSLKNDFDSASEGTQMYYHLLCIKANDKAYIPHTTDSLILPVLHYYIDKNDRYLPEAYYYASRVYRDLGDAPQALDYLDKAMRCLPDDTNIPLKGQIYSQIGTLLLYQDIYNEAMKVFKESYLYNVSCKDSIAIVYNLRAIADTYRSIGTIDSSLYYYKKSYDLACILKEYSLMNMVQNQMAGLYIQLGEYDLAKAILLPSLNNINRGSKSAIYSMVSKLYHEMGNEDSALYYYKELLDCGTIYARRNANWGIAELALKKGNVKEASIYLKQYMLCDDSVDKITNAENIQKTYSLYNYQSRERENVRLKIENVRKTNTILYCCVAGGILVTILLAYQQYSRKKRLQLEYRLEKSERLKEEQYKKSNLFIEESKKRIAELEKELHDAGCVNIKLKERLLQEQESVYYAQKQAEINMDKQKGKRVILLKSEIYCYIQEQIDSKNYKMDKTKWDLLEKTVNEIYQGFTEKLNSVYKLSCYELQVSLLIKANIPPVEIANLTNHTKPSVSLVRRRLYEKFFNKKGEPKMWDDFINSL